METMELGKEHRGECLPDGHGGQRTCEHGRKERMATEVCNPTRVSSRTLVGKERLWNGGHTFITKICHLQIHFLLDTVSVQLVFDELKKRIH